MMSAEMIFGAHVVSEAKPDRGHWLSTVPVDLRQVYGIICQKG